MTDDDDDSISVASPIATVRLIVESPVKTVTIDSLSTSTPSTPQRPPNSILLTTPNTTNTSHIPRLPYPSLRVSTKDWEQRLQDMRCLKTEMPTKTYRSKQIPGYGRMKTYYFHLSAISIDYILFFKEDTSNWCRVPKNITDVKMKIIELLLTMRKYDEVVKQYTLDQTRFINLLMSQWGGEKSTAEIVDNDKLRLFGLIMSIENNRYILQRLSEGVKERVHIDNPEYAPKVMFQKLALDFSNELLYVKLPSGAEDLDEYDSLNANDSTRMQIMRDGEVYI